ncbi:FMN-binding protein [Desulfoluna spongiiphila]|uniref:FMN-binding protein n=1 Tax=Desulfoluna spongiiphila TaxID=419481 RepID=UPI00125C7F9D|nr:FMN-binding protein [Desulfoluna spongiiphila]VVS94266.1 fmn-binding [Desulfoluna spongiiphila]
MNLKKTLTILGVLALAGALAYGRVSRENKTIRYLSDHFAPAAVEKTGSSPEAYRVVDGGETQYLIYPGRTTGWGGPMTVAPVLTPKLVLKEVLVPEHRETPLFFEYLLANGFFEQFAGKTPRDALCVGKTIDAVSGATISSKAITRAVDSGMALAAEDVLGVKRPALEIRWHAGKEELLLLALFAAALACTRFKLTKAKMPLLILGFLFLGLMMSRPVSVSNIAALFMGHAPFIGDDLFWWLLVPGSLALVALSGKNIYCTRLCPFGALQELIARTGGLRVSVQKKIQAVLRAGALGLTWLALMVAFATGNAAHAAIEPFATLFGLKGTTVQWYLVSLALGGSFFIPRFWCRFFCPAGVCFRKAAGLRRSVTKGITIQPHMGKARHETPTD